MVKDINAAPVDESGTDGSNPQVFAELHGVLFLWANDADHGRELWRSDGTTSGTALVKDINPGPASAVTGINQTSTVVGDTVFFVAQDGAHGFELWKSDGTEAGTVLVKDINSASFNGHPFSSFPQSFTPHDGVLFLTADDGVHGSEVWKSDGTEAGTVLVKDIGPTPFISTIGWFSEIHGALLFAANDQVHGAELWRTDGTEAGTFLVKDVVAGASPAIDSLAFDRAEFDGSLFFPASNRGQLWKSDGTEAGTVLVKDFCPGTCLAFVDLRGAAVVGGRLYFSILTFDASGSHPALWATDGTAVGTVLVRDFAPGVGSIFRPADVGGTLFFDVDDGVHGAELWKSDGTPGGTTLVKDVNPGLSPAVDFNSARDFIVIDGAAYFTANDGFHGVELWKSDGNEAGTVLVKDIVPGAAGHEPIGMVEFDGALMFKIDDGVHGMELWRSDGSEAGTSLIQDIVPGPAGSGDIFFRTEPTRVGNRVFFSIDDGVRGYELWAARAAILAGRPLLAIQDLRDEILRLDLSGGVERELSRALDEAALALSGSGGSVKAVAALDRFTRLAGTLSPRLVTPEEATSLAEFAQDIVGLLGGRR